MTDVNIGPTGNGILWMKETPDSEADRAQTDIYLTYRNDLLGSNTTATVQLTRAGNNEEPRFRTSIRLRFSPGGSRTRKRTKAAESRSGDWIRAVGPPKP